MVLSKQLHALELVRVSPPCAFQSDGHGFISEDEQSEAAALTACWPLHDRAEALAGRLRGRDRELVRGLLTQVWVQESRIDITCLAAAIARLLGVTLTTDAPAALTLTSDMRLIRSGRHCGW